MDGKDMMMIMCKGVISAWLPKAGRVEHQKLNHTVPEGAGWLTSVLQRNAICEGMVPSSVTKFQLKF